MDKVRGILMLFVGAFALYRGIIMHTRQSAWLAIILVVAMHSGCTG